MEDKAAMQAMFQLAKVHTKSCGVGTLAPGKCAGAGVRLAHALGWDVWEKLGELQSLLLFPAVSVTGAHCHHSQRTGVCSTLLPPRW